MNEEYRKRKKVDSLIKAINKKATRRWRIMEICGGQTHSIIKNGIEENLSSCVEFIHDPECPVCISPSAKIDKIINLYQKQNTIILTFGDMVRVHGNYISLSEAKTNGNDIRIVYSPLDSLKIAKENPNKEVVFFAIGFETTMPLYSVLLLSAEKMKLNNLTILSSLYSVTGILDSLFHENEISPDGILAAGHVCAVTGYEKYYSFQQKYNLPICITGFEPLDILFGVYRIVEMLENGVSDVVNEYSRVVSKESNAIVAAMLDTVFDISDQDLRGFGKIINGGYKIKERFEHFNACYRFRNEMIVNNHEETDCIAAKIMCGKHTPLQCHLFGNECTP